MKPSIAWNPSIERRLLLPILIAFLAIFSLLHFVDFQAPGFLLFDAGVESDAAQLAQKLARGRGLDILNFRCPLYHGKHIALLMLPFFYMFGAKWLIVKLWPIAFEGLTLVCTYVFVKKTLNREAAVLTILLTLIHPIQVLGIRTGNWSESCMTFFSTASLLLLVQGWRSRRKRWVFLAGLSLGVGLGTRLWFIWFLLALLASGAVFAPLLYRRFQNGKSSRWQDFGMAGFFGLMAGSFLLWHTEFTNGFPSLERLVAQRIKHSGGISFSGAALWNFAEFNNFLTGKSLHFDVFRLNFDRADLLFPVVFWTAVTWCALSGLFIFSPWKRRLRWASTLFLFMFALAACSATTKEFENMHFIIFHPLPQMIVAAAFLDFIRLLNSRKTVLLAYALLVACVIVPETRATSAVLETLHRCGGRGMYTMAMPELAGWLTKSRPANLRIFTFHAGTFNELSLRAPGLEVDREDAVLTLQSPNRNTAQAFYADWESKIAESHGPVWLVLWPQQETKTFSLLSRWARRVNAPFDLKARFYDGKNKNPAFEVYETMGGIRALEAAVTPVPTRGARPAPGDGAGQRHHRSDRGPSRELRHDPGRP